VLSDLASVRVYLATGATDMRKAIHGLALRVEDEFGLDPFSGCVFVFCNRRRDILKALYYSRNGFCLFQKHLQTERFRWPMQPQSEPLIVSRRELSWLLDGLDLRQPMAHKSAEFGTML
jgi:transposase